MKSIKTKKKIFFYCVSYLFCISIGLNIYQYINYKDMKHKMQSYKIILKSIYADNLEYLENFINKEIQENKKKKI